MTLIQLHMFTVVLTLTLLATVPGTSALSSSESFGLESIFKANPVILGSLFPPWSDDSRGACGMKTGNPWYGVKCSEDGEHVEILCLAGVGLNTSLPSLPFSSLLHLQILNLSSTGLHGVISPRALPRSLKTLDLSNNLLSLCSIHEGSLPPLLTRESCSLHYQDQGAAISETSCYARRNSTLERQCRITKDSGPQCRGSPPLEAQNWECLGNGTWLVNSSHQGGITVNGTVLINGDYVLQKSDLLVFWGVDSRLEVRGRLTLNEIVYIYLEPISERKVRIETGTLYEGANRPEVWFMADGFFKIGAPELSTKPERVKIYARANKPCAAAYGWMDGTGGLYRLNLVSNNVCSVPFIIGMAIGLPAAITFTIGPIVMYLTRRLWLEWCRQQRAQARRQHYDQVYP